jgi:hypothetical protein
MIRGDISEAIPRRILITNRAISDKSVSDKKFLWFKTGEVVSHSFNREVLSMLWKFVAKTGAALELIVFEEDGYSDSEAMQLLEAFGTSPINYARQYETIDDLIEDLPYRPEVLGILDLPEYSGRYGGWAISPLYFDRIL